MTAIVRKATEKDLTEITQMGRIFFMEAAWGDVCEWDDLAAYESLYNMVVGDNCIIMVAEQDNKIIGMVGAVLFPLWFNPAIKMGQEFFLYVKLEHRGGVGIKLMQALEDEAKENGVQGFAMLAVENLPSLDKFYSKWGYRPSEKTYIKRLN